MYDHRLAVYDHIDIYDLIRSIYHNDNFFQEIKKKGNVANDLLELSNIILVIGVRTKNVTMGTEEKEAIGLKRRQRSITFHDQRL